MGPSFIDNDHILKPLCKPISSLDMNRHYVIRVDLLYGPATFLLAIL